MWRHLATKFFKINSSMLFGKLFMGKRDYCLVENSVEVVVKKITETVMTTDNILQGRKKNGTKSPENILNILVINFYKKMKTQIKSDNKIYEALMVEKKV